ncbi:hypothetical protein KOR34_48050 [Posidoniimonas corsicana]|uniref:DUF1570 domain-containing protein n=1 Tax=Posidoniimonas corsicana TaxID=1938618 RepID=A0A5C5UXJ5_9BACT|nr:hypothetical protein KOR34_48050 [Posidoniimonas corsicana]
MNDPSQPLICRPRQLACLAGGGLRSLAVAAALALLAALAGTSLAQSAWPTPKAIDALRLEPQGLRVLQGEHLTLITDLPSDPEVDALPRLFDAAVPLWAERFDVPAAKADAWRVQGCLIGDREKFRAAGLLPAGGESFPHGLSKGYELWVMEQDSPYYRRHLLLHEGTHSFMATQLGSCGPGWYMEGMAELLGAHRWDPKSGELAIGVIPPDGRVGQLQDAFREKQALPIAAVMKINNDRILPNRAYAWVGALAHLLDAHPRYQQRFRELTNHVLDPEFNDRFRQAYADDWSDLSTEWRLMIATLQYGHGIAREAIDFQRGKPLAAGVTATIAADRGWQSTGVLVEAGQQYEVQAAGRYTIAVEPDGRPVPCEAGGVTLDYHAGAPLGMLLAAIDPRDAAGQKVSPAAKGGFLRPARLGLASRFRAPYSGTLYLRVNDSPAKLADNSGELRVKISGAP